MKKNRSLIPGQNRNAAKVAEAKAAQQPQGQPLEVLLLQFGDHARNISKSLSAMGDIATMLYNELQGRAQRIQELEAELAKLKGNSKPN